MEGKKWLSIVNNPCYGESGFPSNEKAPVCVYLHAVLCRFEGCLGYKNSFQSGLVIHFID
jgi:hypothetical protein